MLLHKILSPGGSRKTKKRVGRGEGSGHGKTSGRGGKGQSARAGYGMRPGFESGHIQTHRKLPKRGFSNFEFRVEYVPVNVGDLNDLSETTIDREVLVANGLMRKNENRFKVLAMGEVTRAFTVKADKFSATAKAKIEAAGGKCIELAPAEEPAA